MREREREREGERERELSLRDKYASDIMTPRTVMSFVLLNDNIEQVIDKNPIMVHGRLPVFDGDTDSPKGLVLRSDIYRKAAAQNQRNP